MDITPENAIIAPSPKQIHSILESNARMNFWIGSVRSGKTWAVNARIIKEIKDGPKGDGMLIGTSREALQRNVVRPLCQFLSIPAPTDKATRMVLWNRVIHLIGAPDERAQARITGSTLAFAAIDEGTLMPYGLFKMLQSRLSKKGAKMFLTSNPNSPFHWLKSEIIDNEDLDLKVFNFNLEDNPSLDPGFVQNIKKEYTGIWYKRYILGQWVLAEGAVYDFFDEAFHTIENPPTLAREYIVGIDYGTTNPCVFVLIGIDNTQFPNMWCEKEYVFDSTKESRQKTDSEYAEDLAAFISGYNVTSIYVDPTAASFKLECRKAGISIIFDAENDVHNGIRFQTQHLQNGSYKICKNCKRTIEEYGNYLWDLKAANHGIERPLKSNDHTKDAERYAIFTHLFNRSSDRLHPEEIDKWWAEGQGYEAQNLPPFFRGSNYY
ncbi:hypothetical protein LCGC14_1303190 [marine sediment metagenome]|uniref:Uncharacterized protein n=1 Tax=marine sediment metagenome TaxID=412755 RepID=A0A0F9KPD7_9ZZZZ